MKTKIIFFISIIGIAYYLLFMGVFGLLQSPGFYNSFFAGFMPTYEIQNNQITVVQKPFTAINEKSFVENMDAYHYSCIKNNLYNYDPNDEVSRSNFAFFPMFPLLWKFSFFSGREIGIVNFLLHLASIVVLVFVFCRNAPIIGTLCVLALPTLTVFLIPYSEALFMLSVSVALLGWKQNNKMLYVFGLVIASTTRPVFILLIASCITVEIYFWLCDRNKKIDFKHIALTISAILGGTFLVTLFQQVYHHGSLLTFIDAQKHWGTFLQTPKTIVDWSNEGYGMNVWAMLFCFLIGGVVLVGKLMNRKKEDFKQFDYWYYFSWVYMMFAVVFVLFLQGGCLHSLYRYTLCTPFFYIILFQHINASVKPSLLKSVIVFFGFIACCLVFIKNAGYDGDWNFSKTGFILLSLNLLFFLFMKQLSNTQKYVGFSVLILGGIFWNGYLLNMFLAKAWIFL
jgi:hypothetical protein